MALHPDKAAFWTRIAQIGAIALLGVAAAVAVLLPAALPEPEDVTPDDVSVIRKLTPAGAGPSATPGTHSDWTTVAPLLAWAAPESAPVVVVEKPPRPNGTEGGEEVVPLVGPLSSWRYLGAVRKPTGSLALVTVDGKQRFIGTGDRVGQYEIEEILADRIRVRGDGTTQEVRLQTPPALPFTLATPTGPAGQPGFDPQQSELERRLQEEAERDRARRDAEEGGRANPINRRKSR